MNRDELRGRSGRKQQWMRRVSDIVGAAGHGLDGRPAEAVPRDIQRSYRDASIDDADARKLRGEVEDGAIFPGARKQGDLVFPFSRKRLDRLMNILANAGPRAQRRTVIDHYPHNAPEPTISLSISVLVNGLDGYILCAKVADLSITSGQSRSFHG